jgi:enolase
MNVAYMSENFIITRVDAREVLDSRGNPTIEAEVQSGSRMGKAAVPSGASTGTHEALELRDHDPNRYHGLGVQKAVRNVREIIGPRIIGTDAREQKAIDQIMIDLDGTTNKSKLGANSILAVSLAVAKLASALVKKPLYSYLSKDEGTTLPVPVMNVINGGKHAGTDLKIQEFMIIPAGCDTFSNSLRMGAEIYHSLKRLILAKYGTRAINVGDEGGFAPPMHVTSDVLEVITQAISDSGYSPGKEVFLGLDAASSEFYKDGIYNIDGQSKTGEELTEFYTQLLRQYPIRYIEDPFEQEAFENMANFTKRVGSKIQIVGDDIFVTNISRLKKGIEMGCANALLLKVNQVGTLTEAMEAARMARANQYGVVTSHRSGETEDSTIADLAVALNCGQIKAGAPCRGERTAKYNRLLRVEEQLAGKAIFPGAKALKRQ